MTVPVSALPKHVRVRLPQPPPQRRRAVEVTALPSGNKGRWRCAICGEVYDWWAPMQRHSNESGHARVEIVWDEGEAT